MTVLEDEIATDTPTPSAPRRRVGWRATVIALAGLAAAGCVAWQLVAGAALGGVTVLYDAQPITCTGAEVGVMPAAIHDEFLSQVVQLKHGARCELRIQVMNDGWAEVQIDAVTLRMLAAGNATDLEVPFVNPNGSAGVVEGQDVVFALQGPLVVGAGELQTLEAPLVYGGDPHHMECTSTSWSIPAVTVSSHGQTRVLEPPAHSAFAFLFGDVEECG
ncbi:hypothetical protein [Microbacterium sp. HJ5]